jgi:hypothetical protein
MPRNYSYEEISAVLKYDPDVGGSCLIWISEVGSGGSKRQKGTKAGTSHNAGYWSVRYNNRAFLAHRLVWLLNNKAWPDGHIDHINGDRTDTRIENLRDAKKKQADNNQNKRVSFNKTGYAGVSRPKQTTKYRAEITLNKRKIHLGYYDSAEEAHNAYLKAKAEYHTFNPIPRQQ